MSIQGISGPGLSRPLQRPDSEAPPTRGPGHSAAVEPGRPVATPAGGELGAEAPDGVDPALWSVLTTEERAFFARARSLGPLTYGPARAGRAQAGVPLGGRIDIRI